jgi:hypothetical protein
MKKRNSFQALGALTVMLTLLFVFACLLAVSCQDEFMPEVSMSIDPPELEMKTGEYKEINVTVVKSSIIKDRYYLEWEPEKPDVAEAYRVLLKRPDGERPIYDEEEGHKYEIKGSEIVTLVVKSKSIQNQETKIKITLINHDAVIDDEDKDKDKIELTCTVTVGSSSTTVDMPVANPLPSSGPVLNDTVIELTAQGATIWYTQDGTKPTAGAPSKQYSSNNKPKITPTTLTLKAIAVKGGVSSEVRTYIYEIATGPIDVAFSGVTPNGGNNEKTTLLTLTFDKAIPGLVATDITLSGVTGVTRGALSGSGPTYTLGITNNSADGGDLTVKVAKTGYTFTPDEKTVTIYGTSSPPQPNDEGSASITITWNDAEELTISPATATIGQYDTDDPTNSSNKVNIAASGIAGNKKWYVDGVLDTSQTGNAYEFKSADTGQHIVTFVVEKNGKAYSAYATITVN